MAKRILITREIPRVGIQILKDAGFEVDVGTSAVPLTKSDLLRDLSMKPYDGVLSLLTDPFDSEVFASIPTVKILANYAVGFDNIDVVEAQKRGVVVTNTAGVSSGAVAEHAVALILALTTRLLEGDRAVREGTYMGWSPMAFMGTDLEGKRVGLVGVGNIGARVAAILSHGFGAHVFYYDVRENSALEKECGATRLGTLEELLSQSEIVSLHVPLLPSTRHLINKERLALMKSDSFLINTARGPVVDEAALCEALRRGVIRGAALDVFEFEPRLTPGLAELSNVVLTPHIASSRESVRNEMARSAAQGIVDFFAGKKPENALA